MRDGTFLRCIFLCFLFKANEVGLPVATWARHSDTRDTLTSHSQSLSHHLQHPPPTPPRHHHHHCNHPPPSALSRAQRRTHTHAMTRAVCENTHTHIHTRKLDYRLDGCDKLTLWAHVYSRFIIKAADLFIFTVSKQQASIIQRFFFFFVSRLSSFFPTCL